MARPALETQQRYKSVHIINQPVQKQLNEWKFGLFQINLKHKEILIRAQTNDSKYTR